MTKQKQVTIKMDLSTAGAVRQVHFDSQRGYSDEYTPERILNIRTVIAEIDCNFAHIIGVDV